MSPYDLLIFNLPFLQCHFNCEVLLYLWLDLHLLVSASSLLLVIYKHGLHLFFWVIVISCHCKALNLSILCLPFESLLLWLIMPVCCSCQWGEMRTSLRLSSNVCLMLYKPGFIFRRRTFHFLFSVLYQILSLKSVVLNCRKNSTETSQLQCAFHFSKHKRDDKYLNPLYCYRLDLL